MEWKCGEGNKNQKYLGFRFLPYCSTIYLNIATQKVGVYLTELGLHQMTLSACSVNIRETHLNGFRKK